MLNLMKNAKMWLAAVGIVAVGAVAPAQADDSSPSSVGPILIAVDTDSIKDFVRRP